ncbi:alanine racemase [Candidatus Bathyarchaeota archaeon]|nr:alanine racemase [Candidatus Bathyarchaeota archaeon]
MSIIGKPVEEVPTPALILDLEKFQWNIDKMFKFAKKAGVQVRPHAKTFKAAAICNKLIEAGANGVMTQKLSEAEVLLNSGILYGDKTILISQEISDPGKIERVVGMTVAMGEGKIITSIDSLQEAEMISRIAERWGIKQDVLIEITHGRCGVSPGEDAVWVAKRLMKLPGVNFKGIYGYENPVDREIALARDKLTVDTANAIRDVGIDVEIVSAGSTATYEVTGTYKGITEIEPGSFVFGAGSEGSGYGWDAKNDVFFKNSLTVLTQVISDRHQDRIVTDAGVKVMSGGHSGVEPIVQVIADGEYLKPDRVGLSEEHGTLYFNEGNEERSKIRWGQKIQFVPNHCCTTVNQHDELVIVKDNRVCAVWPITTRGRYQ